MNKKTLTLLLLTSVALLSVAGVKVSKLTRTTSFASNDLFIVVTGSTTKVTRHIRASDLAVGLGPWITNSGGGASSVTNAISVVRSNGTAISSAATSLDFIEGTNVTIRATNAAGVVTVQINASGSGSGSGGGAGSLPMNLNQFDTNATVTIKDGAILTNAVIATQLNSQGDTLLTGSSGITANRAMYLDIGKKIQTSANVSSTELEYLDGVTSAIQDQLGSKQAGSFTLTNFALMGITNIVSANGNTVITTNAGVLTLTTASGSGGVGPTNANQFGASLTLSIKDGALLTNTSIRTALTLPTLTASRAAVLNSTGQLTNSAAVSDVELEYLDGVTSAIQTQLGTKTALATNSSQFGASTTLTIADRVSLTNLNSYGTGAVFSGHVTVASNLTAASFIGSGTGVPILKLQTMMAADNALGLSVRTNFTQLSTNFWEFTSPSAGQAMVLHSAAAGQLVWTNASSTILTNMIGMSFDYGLLYAATNTTAGTNFAINFSPNNTNHIDFFTTNWWCQWTNISGLAQGSLANKTIRITPSAPGSNLTNVWPVGSQHGIYRWVTNANSPILTVLTTGKTYVLSLTAYGTNIHASMSLWEP